MGELLDTVHLETDAGGYFSSGEILGGMGIGYIISTEYLGISYSFESDYPVSNLPVTLSSNLAPMAINKSHSVTAKLA